MNPSGPSRSGILVMIHNRGYPQIYDLEPNQSELLGVLALILIPLHSKNYRQIETGWNALSIWLGWSMRLDVGCQIQIVALELISSVDPHRRMDGRFGDGVSAQYRSCRSRMVSIHAAMDIPIRHRDNCLLGISNKVNPRESWHRLHPNLSLPFARIVTYRNE